MGATLDETRLELEAQRTRVRGTASSLESAARRSLDVKSIIRSHPGRTIGLAAGAAYFLLGGPHRTIRAVRRALGGSADGARAYAALPQSLRSLVDQTAPGHGDAKAVARGHMALALHAWREDPKNRKKADRLVSETLTPPGPERAFWALVEVAAVTAAGIIGRRVVARRLMSGVLRPPAQPPPVGATKTDPDNESAPPAVAVKKTKPSASYSGWSGQSVSTTVKPPREAVPRPDDGR